MAPDAGEKIGGSDNGLTGLNEGKNSDMGSLGVSPVFGSGAAGGSVGVGARKPLGFVVGFVAVLLVLGTGVYLNLQRAAVLAEQEQIEGEVSAIRLETGVLEEAKVEAARQAQEWLAAIEKDEVRWSEVVSKVEDVIPVDPATGRDAVVFLSYSGGQGGRLNLNAQTVPKRTEPFDAVSQLITVFNANPFFANAYVPSVTRSETNEGDRFASFVFNVEYREEQFEGLENTRITTPSPVATPDTPAVPVDASLSEPGSSS